MNSPGVRSIFTGGRHPQTVIRYLVMIVLAATSFYPFYWVAISSLKSNAEIFGQPFALPSRLHFENYVIAWKTANIGTYFLNSMVVSISAVFVIILAGSMAAYVLARVTENAFLYLYFTLGIMIPVHTILIPTFILLKNFALLNTRTGLILLYIVSNLSLAIFILVGFMKTIPKEIEEAAIIDGASHTRVFFSVIFPISRPAIATIGMLAFLNCWNEYLFAYVIISANDIKTITQGIFMLQGVYATDWGPLTAGMVMSMLPVILVYVLFQEQVIEGMTAGALKG